MARNRVVSHKVAYLTVTSTVDTMPGLPPAYLWLAQLTAKYMYEHW